MKFTFTLRQTLLPALALAVMSTNCHPDPATETASAELGAEVKGENAWQKDIKIQYILSVQQLQSYCKDCEAPGCETNCEYELNSLPVARMLVIGGGLPMPCEPPLPGVYFPNYLLSMKPAMLKGLPEELYNISGNVNKMYTEEIDDDYLQLISSGQKIMGVGPVALCLPPPPPPPRLDEWLTNFILEVPNTMDENVLGLLYKDKKLLAIASPDRTTFSKDEDTRKLPFYSIQNLKESVEGKYTYIVRFNQKNEKGQSILTEMRFENLIE